MVVVDHGSRFSPSLTLRRRELGRYRLAEILPVPLSPPEAPRANDSLGRLSILQRFSKVRDSPRSLPESSATRSFLTGAGTAAAIASSTGSQICPGSAARGGAEPRSRRIGVMSSVKWVNACRSTGSFFPSEPLSPGPISGKHHSPPHTPAGGRFSSSTSPSRRWRSIEVFLTGLSLRGRGSG
jgi:hypothetical protein